MIHDHGDLDWKNLSWSWSIAISFGAYYLQQQHTHIAHQNIVEILFAVENINCTHFDLNIYSYIVPAIYILCYAIYFSL